MTRGPEDWSGPEKPRAPGRFAGIELAAFQEDRRRRKWRVWFWVAAVLIVTGLVAAAAWTLGTNINALL